VRVATGLPVQIKWPNDIVAVDGRGFRSRRKLSGILAEAISDANGLQYIVLGVGINISAASFPPDLADRASSLETELGRPADRGQVLAQLLVRLNRELESVDRDGPAGLLSRWSALAPSAHGAAVEWETTAGTRSGVTAGLDADGALLVRDAGGLHRIIAGEVRW
jgi:BirA family biotin operon repressor/biotin-[acetyl-CoA-carboxylase] ligase